MSVVELRVELPSYSHSFIIQVPLSYNIFEVKGEITRSCTGQPKADGQRIIWRGRVLRDEEKVEDIWKSNEDSRTVHLAVNPSAWSSTPPQSPSAAAAPAPVPSYFTTPQAGLSMPAFSPALQPTRTPLPSGLSHGMSVHPSINQHPMGFVVYKHQNAISALTLGRIVNEDEAIKADMDVVRPAALQAVERNGYSWPTILDEPFPGVDSEGVALSSLPEGVKYERVVLNNQVLLSLLNEGATPNIFQAHALKVLTYTFPLLALSAPSQTTPIITTIPHQHTVPREVNQLLQQLGLPQLRYQNPVQNQNRLFRDIPLRPLIAPFVMLIIRTLLLVYFVSPARKPVFGIVVGAWILYEAWGPIRAAIFGAAERQAAAAGVPPVRQPGQGVAARPGPDQNGAAQPRAQGAVPVPRPFDRTGRQVNQADAIIDGLANINIPAEGEALEAAERARPAEEPGFIHKIGTFLILFVLTLHPAVWNRRRGILRQREGRVRTEANAREREPQTPPADSNNEDEEDAEDNRAERERIARVRTHLAAQHTRRPMWVKAYVDRVRGGEWVDE